MKPGCRAHSERVLGTVPGWKLSMWSLHVLLIYAWVLLAGALVSSHCPKRVLGKIVYE